jgi:hypothetical protein
MQQAIATQMEAGRQGQQSLTVGRVLPRACGNRAIEERRRIRNGPFFGAACRFAIREHRFHRPRADAEVFNVWIRACANQTGWRTQAGSFAGCERRAAPGQ